MPMIVVVPVVVVPPIVFVAPAPAAHTLEFVAGFTCHVAVRAETVDNAIEVPLGVLDTVAAVAAPAPRLGLSQRAAQ